MASKLATLRDEVSHILAGEVASARGREERDGVVFNLKRVSIAPKSARFRTSS
jgi:hypothetical protein